MRFGHRVGLVLSVPIAAISAVDLLKNPQDAMLGLAIAAAAYAIPVAACWALSALFE